NVELEIEVLDAAVVAAADKFGASQEQADMPAGLVEAAFKADAAWFEVGFEQVGNLLDEASQPDRTDVPARTGFWRRGLQFDFADQMLDRQVRVTHADATPGRQINSIPSRCLRSDPALFHS